MRFHRYETAFFVFVALVLMAGALILYAYNIPLATAHGIRAVNLAGDVGHMRAVLFVTGLLLSVALTFGIFFIYPLIRIQVREEDKLRAMTATLSARSISLEQAALTDGLTGAQNRRYFDDALREYLDEFRRIGRPVGLMILDLDHFKMVNDNHGHDVGDQVLRDVAHCLKQMTRYHDVVARLGGEEFAVIAPNMDHEILVRFAERIRKGVSNLTVVSGNIALKVTASVGIAVWDRRESADDLYRRADKLLYQAKTSGRNRVCA